MENETLSGVLLNGCCNDGENKNLVVFITIDGQATFEIRKGKFTEKIMFKINELKKALEYYRSL